VDPSVGSGVIEEAAGAPVGCPGAGGVVAPQVPAGVGGAARPGACPPGAIKNIPISKFLS